MEIIHLERDNFIQILFKKVFIQDHPEEGQEIWLKKCPYKKSQMKLVSRLHQGLELIFN